MNARDGSDNRGEDTGPPTRSRWRRGGIVLAVLLVLVGMLVGWENWRGASEWNALKAEWSARGEPFESAAIKPAPVADAENFASTPFLAPLLDYTWDPVGRTNRWRDEAGRQRATSISPFGDKEIKSPASWHQQRLIDMADVQAHYREQKGFPRLERPGRPGEDVLKAMSRFDDVMGELQQAATRPKSRYAIHYEENFACLLPHLAVLKSLARITEFKALAHLDLGQSEEALGQVKLGLRLADSLREEPLLISQLVRIAMVDITMQAVWQGFAKDHWKAAQIKDLEQELRSLRLLASLRPCLRGERVLASEAIDLMRRDPARLQMLNGNSDPNADAGMQRWGLRLVPRGWFDFNKVTLARMHLEFMHKIVNDEGTRAFPERAAAMEEVMNTQLRRFSVRRFLAAMLFPAVSNAGQKFAAQQGGIDLAIGACVLEQYRLEKGQYPETLDELPAAVRDRIPKDLIGGAPLKYARQGARFMLYSIGWNQADDGGKIGLTESRDPRWDSKKGDWVWGYPQG